MTDTRLLFERQEAWQKARKDLSWSQKIRLVEALQGSIRQLRGLPCDRTKQPTGPSGSNPALE
jgi:hypothetical protein